MDRLSFKSGELKLFIQQVQSKLDVDSEGLAKLVGLSGRTIRDWKREKFKPTKEHIQKISTLSKVEVPKHEILPQYWNIPKAGHLGGIKRFELYGLLGTKESRSKGGINSWVKRKSNPLLWNKYTIPIIKPEESTDLAEFIGIMLGDGGLTHFQCCIYLNSETDQEFAYYVRTLVNKLFGITPKIYVHKKHKVWRVSVSGVNLIEYLRFKGLSIGDKVRLQVGVPEWVCSQSDYVKVCMLRYVLED